MSLTEKQIEEIKESLIESKEEIEKDLKDSEKNLDFGDDYGSAWEEEETDEAEEYSNFVGAEFTMKKRLTHIESALRKIEEGTYGKCEECNKEISEDVLKTAPESKLCKECKKKTNK